MTTASTPPGMVARSGYAGSPSTSVALGFTAKTSYPRSFSRLYTALAACAPGVRDTPVTATRLLARKSAAASAMVAMMVLLTSGFG